MLYIRPARTKNGILKCASNKRRSCAIERFCLKIGLPDCPLNSDSNSIKGDKGDTAWCLHAALFRPFSGVFQGVPKLGCHVKKWAGSAKREEMSLRPLREWKMKCFRGLVRLSAPILLLSPFTGLSGKPTFSRNASIAHQCLFWLRTAFCMRNLPFFVRAVHKYN